MGRGGGEIVILLQRSKNKNESKHLSRNYANQETVELPL